MLPSLLSWPATLLMLAKTLTTDPKKQKEIADAEGFYDLFKNSVSDVGPSSVQKSASRTLIAPMVLFEDSLMYQEYMPDLINIINLRDIRDALTHISLQGISGHLKIANLVDQINPNRAAGFNALIGCEAFDSDEDSLIRRAVYESRTSKGKDGKREKNSAKGKTDAEIDAENEKDEKNNSDRLSIDSNDVKNLTEYVPLALGKTVKAAVTVDGKELSFLLTFRQIPVSASAKNIELMFTSAKKGEVWKARFKEYAAGGITRPELLRGTDIIKREFNIRNNDLSGYYNETNRRERQNRAASLRTGYVSLNTDANTIIISKDTADNIELELGMRFSSPKIKTIRKYMNANTIVVVNDARGVFEFYSVGDPIPVKYTLQQIKMKSKKDDTGSLESLIKLLSGR